MAKEGLSNDWTKFKNETAVHGFAEYQGIGRILGVVGKIVWILFAAGVGVFCVWELEILVESFVERQPVTHVGVQQFFNFPYTSVRLESSAPQIKDQRNGLYWNMTALRKAEQSAPEVGAIGMGGGAGAIFGSTSESILENYQNMVILPRMFYEVRNLTKLEEFEYDTSSRFAPTGSGCPPVEPHLLPAKKVFWDMVDNAGGLEAYYREIMPKPANFPIADVKIGDVPVTVKPVLQMHLQGPQYVLFYPNTTVNTEEVNTIQLRILKRYGEMEYSTMVNNRYFLNIGTIAALLDRVDGGIELRTEDTDKHLLLEVRLTKYTRTAAYCDADQTAWEVGCLSACRIKKARTQAGGCLPALLGVPHNIRACDPTMEDQKVCQETYDSCKKFCRSCTTCRPCTAIVADLTISEMMSVGVGAAGFTLIKFVQEELETFSEREQWTTATILSQIGGILGLCFGVSLIAIGHAFLVLLGIMRHLRGQRQVK